MLESDPVLEVRGLCVRHAAREGGRPSRAALADVNLQLGAGEMVGLVGESGSGKSTLVRAVARLLPAEAGEVRVLGLNWLRLHGRALREQRRHLQLVFQDPLASLNPRMSVGEALSEPLRAFHPRMGAPERREAVAVMLERVGLSAADASRYPRLFSGGQCQRIAIARAMIAKPRILICDEPVSSLDVSIRGQILNLLLDLQRDAGTSMLFISHDLAVVRHLCRRTYVLLAGRIVDEGPTAELFARPHHPYTLELLAAAPRLGG
ncbi:MAG: ABC transporter ATP-binding protein [Proteobacteria bacterium]|nr:ABC transporter ATP-binding protein [Pseudomonadota bacterium]